MKISAPGFIVWKKYSWLDEPVFGWQSTPVPNGYQSDEYTDTVQVCEHVLEVEVPDDFNPVPLQIAGLEEAKRRARLALAAELAKIDDRIGKLLCIPPPPVGEPVEPRAARVDTSEASDVVARPVPSDDDDYPF